MATKQNTPPAEDAIVETSGVEWDLFWHMHKSKILLGLIGIAVVGIASAAWYVTGHLTARASESLLAKAKDIAGYEDVVKEYPRSMSAAAALLQLAVDQRAAGKPAESTADFNKFLASFPTHPLAGGALLGVGQNQDAAGDSKGALETYRRVVATYPKSYAAPFASYSQAEILLREYRKDEARRVLESVLVQFPGSHVASMAGAQLARIGAKPVVAGAGAVVPQ